MMTRVIKHRLKPCFTYCAGALGIVSLALLAACSFAPLPFTVNLLERFPAEAEGSFAFSTPSGRVDLLPYLGEFGEGGFTLPGLGLPLPGVTVPVPRFVLPSAAGYAVDFSDQALPARFEEVTIDYRLGLMHNGALDGQLELQVYLAPLGTDSTDQEAYALGEPLVYDLSEATTVLSASILLNPAQLQAINERRLRLALALQGSVSFSVAQDITLTYRFEALELTVGGITATVDEVLPDAAGVTLDFSDEEVPGPGRIVGLGLDYGLTVSHGSVLGGSITAQVYVAPPGADELWQEKYAFGAPKTIDLAQNDIGLAENASLRGEQLEILPLQRLRVGVRVTGTPALPLGEEVRLSYRFTRLLLRLHYAL